MEETEFELILPIYGALASLYAKHFLLSLAYGLLQYQCVYNDFAMEQALEERRFQWVS